jgi:uncharacterized membrane protein
MKSIDKFGAWLLDTKAGMIFGIIIALTGASITGYQILKGPKTVTLNASEYACVQAEPWGISTRCTAYARVR